MNPENITVQKALAERDCELPGSDLGKTLGYMLFLLILLVLVTDNPLFDNTIPSLEIYQGISFLTLIACIGLAVYSAWVVMDVSQSSTKEIEGYFSLFKGKFILMISILLFFMVISMWFMVLGGIVSSPFASLLTISPILLTIQWVRDRPTNYDKILWAIKPHLIGAADCGTKRHDIIKWVIALIGAAPIIVIVATITCGEFLIIRLELHKTLTSNSFEDITASQWYLRAYIITYFFSIVVAAFGAVPQHITQQLAKKWLL